MASIRRMAIMAGLTVFRAFRSPLNIVWILILPIALSLLVGSWFAGTGPAMGQWVQRETPRGVLDTGEYLSVRSIFGIYLVFVLTTLITRAGTIHDERINGRLGRTLGYGVPYHEIVLAHVVSIVLIGLVQAVVFLLVTGVLGTRWLLAGWAALLISFFGALMAAAGLAIGIAGFARSDGQIQFISAGAPSLLGLMGGSFFPLTLVPAGIQRLAVVNPIYWSMEVLDGGYVYQGITSQIGPLAVLLLFGTLGLVMGVQGFRRLEP